MLANLNVFESGRVASLRIFLTAAQRTFRFMRAIRDCHAAHQSLIIHIHNNHSHPVIGNQPGVGTIPALISFMNERITAVEGDLSVGKTMEVV